ncbi:MAG: lytic murein transglycosylase [Telmatospirillum sp.]|nr:lytic murein transglycosylase [Telmatospirillum sp.]
MLTVLATLAIPASAGLVGPVHAAETAEAGGAERTAAFARWLEGVRREARGAGIPARTLDKALTGIAPIDKVIELDRRQPEFTLSFADYLARAARPERVAEGKELLVRHHALLREVERRYGVPAPVIVAMWGIESDFGRRTGDYPVVAALATLAFDGRRSRYFRQELINVLKIAQHGIEPDRLRGSWAGAMGQCQFMPTTYLKFARSWHGGGAPDIWQTPADVFASTANYLAKSGWNAGHGWGMAVRLPPGGLRTQGTRRSLKAWAKLGVRLADGRPLPLRSDPVATLVRADTPGAEGEGPLYLVYGNYHVLTTWNRSVFFALAAGTLADRLASK